MMNHKFISHTHAHRHNDLLLQMPLCFWLSQHGFTVLMNHLLHACKLLCEARHKTKAKLAFKSLGLVRYIKDVFHAHANAHQSFFVKTVKLWNIITS